jgi:hypothetical protein
VIADEAYIRESIANPAAKIKEGFAPVMIPYQLSDADLNDLIDYLMTMGATSASIEMNESGNSEESSPTEVLAKVTNLQRY